MAGSAGKVSLVLLGKTDSGKSSSGNTILGTKKFKASGKFKSVTTGCAWEKTVLKDGTTVEVTDTPGLCDTRKSDEDTATIITQTVVGMHPGAHALIYVLNAGRFTDEEYYAFKKLEALFDQRLYDYLIVVITGGDNLEADDISVEDTIKDAPAALRKLLDDCKNRYVVFNNRSKDPAQVDTLLQMVKGLVRKNGSKPHYSCAQYKGLGDGYEKEVKKRVGGVEEEQLKEQKVFKDKMEENKKKLDAAVAENTKTKEEAEEAKKEDEIRMKNMKAEHEKALLEKEEQVREEIKREAMGSEGGFFEKVVGAGLVGFGLVAAPVVIVAAAPLATAGSVAGLATGALLIAKGSSE